MSLKCGIVGLPNVGKSTLFNALTKAGIPAENYPFCTIEPNVGVVEVPDARLDALAVSSSTFLERAVLLRAELALVLTLGGLPTQLAEEGCYAGDKLFCEVRREGLRCGRGGGGRDGWSLMTRENSEHRGCGGA